MCCSLCDVPALPYNYVHLDTVSLVNTVRPTFAQQIWACETEVLVFDSPFVRYNVSQSAPTDCNARFKSATVLWWVLEATCLFV